jgi:hypothetical protein
MYITRRPANDLEMSITNGVLFVMSFSRNFKGTVQFILGFSTCGIIEAHYVDVCVSILSLKVRLPCLHMFVI